MKKIVVFVLAVFSFFLLPMGCESAEDAGEILSEAAGIGVGVGVGEIEVGKELLPGGIYKLPLVPVLNTGLSEGIFDMRAKLVEGPEIANEEKVSSWFSFAPSGFTLPPDGAENVQGTLSLPPSAPPGDYFIFLEAYQERNPAGQVKISPVAATKLSFTVKPASVLGAYRARFLTFVETNPRIYLVLAAVLFVEAGLVLRRHFRVRIESK